MSTGGLPQVAVKKIDLLKNDYDIKVVEWSCIAWNFVVQKDRIKSLIGEENLITLEEDKTEIFKIISNFNPDFVYMEEIPEFFVPDEITEKIYSPGRSYKIVETTHDSSFQVSSKRWMPDKFVFVSIFNALRYSVFDVPYEVIEYPIDIKNKDRKGALKRLGLDPDWKHVVNVGLFTPRKNQKYLFEIAERLKNEKIKFHFIGNQADNFKWYWEPLLNSKPDNCVIWGERSDVDDFLQAADVFFFASKGGKTDKELNPIAIKEAIEYEMPLFMFNLDVYCGKYDDNSNIKMLNGNIDDDSSLLKNFLAQQVEFNQGPELIDRQIKSMQDLFDVNFTPNENKIDFFYRGEDNFECSISIKDMTSGAPIYWFNWDLWKNSGFYAIPIPPGHRKFDGDPNFRGFKIDFYYRGSEINFYSKELVVNYDSDPKIPELDFSPFDCSYVNYREFFVDGLFDDVVKDGLDNVVDIGANVGLFTKYMFTRNCKKAILVEADPRLRNNIVRMLGRDFTKSKIFMNPIYSEKTKIDFYYSDSNTTIGSLFEPDLNNPNLRDLNKKIELDSIVFDDIIDSLNGDRISILKCDIQGGEYPLFETLRDDQIKLVDNYIIEFHDNTDGRVNQIIQKLEKNGYDYRIADWKNDRWESFDELLVEGTIFASTAKEIQHEKTNSDISYPLNERGYKIKLLHLQTTRNDEREKISRDQISQLSKYGIEYVNHANDPYTSIPPSHNCYRPDSVSMHKFNSNDSMGGGALTPGHYGCYEAHRIGILSEFNKDLDFLLVCEGDCFVEVPLDEFAKKLFRAAEICKSEGIDYFSFGDTNTLDMNNWRQSDSLKDLDNGSCFLTNKIICTQSVMFNSDARDFIFEKFRTHGWDTIDVYYNLIFGNYNRKMGIVSKRLTRQLDGYSLIDNEYKVYRKP